MLKIGYTLWQKNKSRGDTTYWCRVRERGRSPLDVNLHTKNKAQAEAFIMLRKHELELYNAQILAGEQADDSKLLRRGTSPVAQKGPSKPVFTLRACLDSWESDLRRRAFSERTIRTYTKSVEYVLKDLTLPVSTITPETVRRQMTEHDRLKSSTRRSYFVSYKEFLRYCVRHYGVLPEAVDEIPKIHQIQTDRPYWTMEEIRRIIDSVSCKSKLVEDCYRAYFWFMATSGARQGEAGDLEWTDIVDGTVTFRASTTKGNKMRRVPLEWRILDMLSKLPRRGKKVFYDIAPSQPGRFAVLASAVKRSGVRLGGLHTFRHSASMYLYAHTNDIKATAELLGHSAAVALQYYQSSRTPDQLRDMVSKAFEDSNQLPSPMDRLIEADLI